MAKRFSPLILFSDSQSPSSLSTIPGHATQQQQARHLRIPSSYENEPLSERERDSHRMLPPISSFQQQPPSSHSQQTDMDMDIDTEDSQAQRPTAPLTLDKHNVPPNGPQALEDYRSSAETSTQPNAHTTPTPESSNVNTDQKSSSPISMSTTSHQDRNETSTTTCSSLSSSGIVSPPSSYSSNTSSSMDALAKTLSPARVEIHRKRIQRMLQQNSLLWWELVRYTRNLERSERELEREKEQEQLSTAGAAPGTSAPTGSLTKPRGLHLYHHHHHHHHHHPSFPPLHPQQQALSRTLVASSKGNSGNRSQSRSHPYDSSAHRDQNHTSQRQRWPTAETVDYRRSDRPNLSHMDQDGFTDEVVAGTGGMEADRERLPSKYSSASQSPSPVTTPPSTHPTFDKPMSKQYEEDLTQEASPSAYQYTREYYPHSRRHWHHQEGRSSYSPHPSHQQDQYQSHQRRRYDSESSSRRYSSHPDSRYDSGSSTPTTSIPKRLPPMDSHRIDAASNSALNAVHSSGPSSTASSPRSRELSSASTVYPIPHHRGQSDPRYHSSYLTSSHHEPAPPPTQHPHHQQQSLTTPFGQRRTAPSPSEFPPHNHHNLHHHHQHHPPQHPSHNSHQPLASRPSASSSPHPKIEPLPRPVPVKPASFISPSTMSSISPAPPTHHSMASSAPASSSPVAPGAPSPSRTTPPTAVAAGGHHQRIRNTDPATTASGASSTHAGPSGAQSSSHADPNCTNSSNGNNVDPNRKRRGNLPKSVTSVLKAWLVQNAIHPYPTEEEKMRLSEATQLSMNQISNWFINARRRILQPILHEAAAAAVAGTDAPVENVLIVRKGKGSRMHVEMEGVVSGHPGGGPSSTHHQPHHYGNSGAPAGHNHNHTNNHHNESESNEESASFAPVKSAPHSTSPQPQLHNQQSQPQPIMSS